jgi:hypothetical protein
MGNARFTILFEKTLSRGIRSVFFTDENKDEYQIRTADPFLLIYQLKENKKS